MGGVNALSPVGGIGVDTPDKAYELDDYTVTRLGKDILIEGKVEVYIMFTGIVEEIGHIVSVQRHAFSQIITISASEILGGTNIGDSIAVNGVCLTVTSIGSKQFSADVMHETINKSSLGNLRAGMAVNLERAMPANGRLADI